MKMKCFVLLFLLLLNCLSLNGVEKEKEHPITGYGSFTMKFTSLGQDNAFISKDSSFAYLIGVKGALVFKKTFYLGIATNLLVNKADYRCFKGESYKEREYEDNQPCVDEADKYISLYYQGIIAGYIFNPVDFIRVEIGSFFGHGFFHAKNDKKIISIFGFYSQNLFIFEQELIVLYKITKFLGIGTGLSYRFGFTTEGTEYYDFENLSGPSFILDFRFGKM